VDDLFVASRCIFCRPVLYHARVKRTERIAGFCAVLWAWFERHKRTLPWRDLTLEDINERAYRILISEIMLQQTQVPRVVVLYARFLEEFPTMASLARASNAEVIRAWRGLGYNSRALRLRDAARTIVDGHAGVFPTAMEDLLAIKGIGAYTAAAIRNFAFNLPTPCIDTNIRRILHRAFIGPERPDGTWETSDRSLLPLAEEILEAAIDNSGNDIPHDARNWHAALMDFGSIICTKRNPKWDICPLTAAGLMKAAYKVKLEKSSAKKQEPGRDVGGTFVPNRIFRGRIVEQLRDTQEGMALADIGAHISVDWSERLHKKWLRELLEKLEKDGMVARKKNRYLLA